MLDIFRNAIIYVCIFAAAIVALILFIVLKRKRTARLAAEELERRKKEAQHMIDLENERRAKAEEEAKRAIQTREDQILSAVSSVPGSEKYRLTQTQTEATIHSLNITEFSKVYKTSYVAFDLETTGLNPVDDEIVEIGAVLVENGEITKEFHQLVNPGCSMPPDASAVNHITDDMLSGQPCIHQVLPAFLSFVGDNVLAAHNAAFDIKFIAQACMRNRFRIPVGAFDTMTLARYWPEAEDKKLISLCDAAGIEIKFAHRALDDARAVVGLVSASFARRAESRKKKP